MPTKYSAIVSVEGRDGCRTSPKTAASTPGTATADEQTGPVAQPHAVGVIGLRLPGCLQGKSGLADTAHAHQGHDPGGRQVGQYITNLTPSPHEARQPDGQVPGHAVQRPGRRVLGRLLHVHHLPQHQGLGDVPQPMLTQTPERDARRHTGPGPARR